MINNNSEAVYNRSKSRGSSNMKKILFYSEGWGTGGIEAFIMNVARCLDKTRFQFDIFSTHDYDDGYDDELRALGAKRFTVFHRVKPNLLKRLALSTRRWREILRQGNYDIVHINTMNGVGFVYAHIAEQEGIPVRIVHSHNTSFGEGHKLIKGIAHNLGKIRYGDSATVRLAPSIAAGRYLFDKKNFQLLYNSFDTDRFRFDPALRAETRELLHLESDAFVIGNVSRLVGQKNPIFLAKIFIEIAKSNDKAILLIVGQGPLKDEIIRCLESAGVSNKLRIVHATNQIPSYLSAMDVFCVPSIFEGLSIVSVEAQANGLPVVGSDVIPAEARTSNLFHSVSLTESPYAWKSEIIRSSEEHHMGRKHYADMVSARGYGLLQLKQALTGIYEGQ
jgi:glycosyltransferase involved in cell wall biosynthesis